MKTLIILLCLVVTSGCASLNTRIRHVKPGMSPDEVTHELGEPDNTARSGNTEKYIYKVSNWTMEAWNYTGEYWVLFDNGKVSQYGRAIDLSSEAAHNQAITDAAHVQATQQALQMSQQQMHSTPSYQLPVQQNKRTNCITNYISGTAYTNCTGN